MKLFTVLLLIFMFNFVFGQKITLEEAINIALSNNQPIQIARNQIEIAENESHPGQAGLLPNISVQAFNQNNLIIPYQGNNKHKSLSSAGLRTSHTLFNGFGNVNQYKQFRVQESLTQLQSRAQIEEILLSVIDAYYKIAEISESLSIQKNSLNISKERLYRTRQKRKVGQADSVEVLAALVDLNRDSINIIKTKQNLIEAKRNLNRIINHSSAPDFQVDTRINFLDLPESKQLMEKALNNNSLYQASKKNLKLARIYKQVLESEYYPSVDLAGSYGYSKESNQLGISLDKPNMNTTLELSLNFNIFNGFRRNIQNQNAKIIISNRKLYTNQIRTELKQSVFDAFDNYQNNKQILIMEEQNLRSAQLNFERSQEAYQLGQLISTQFRQAQLNLLKAKQGVSSAKYNAKLSEYKILQVTGQLLSRIEIERSNTNWSN